MKLKKSILLASIVVGIAFSGMAQNEPSSAQIDGSTTDNLTADTSATDNVTINAGATVGVDLSQNSLTEKWAGFFGTISGSRVLGDGSTNLYKWTANEFSDAKVISIPKANPVPGSVVGSPDSDANTFLDNYDNDAGFDTGVANASTTFNLSKSTDPLGTGSTTSTYAVETFNSSGDRDSRFTTYLYGDGSGNPVWVAEGTSETSDSFNSDSVNYQMLVGVGEASDGSAGTETFSFYLELP